MHQKILLVDDEPNILKALSRLLDRHGYRVFRASSGAEALQVLQLYACQVVISDFRMPQMDGAALLAQVKLLYPDTVCMVLSGYTDFQAVLQLLNSGSAFRFMQKPWEDQQMLQDVADACQLYRQQRDQQIRDQLLINSQSALLEVDKQGQILRCNGFASEVFALPAALITSQNCQQLLALSVSQLAELWHAALPEPFDLTVAGISLQVERQFAGAHHLLLRVQKNQQADTELERGRLPILAEPGQLDSQINQYLTEQQPFALVALRLKNYGEWADVFGFSEAGELFARFSQRLLAATVKFGTLSYLANEVFLLLLPYARDELRVHQQLSDIQTALKQDDTTNASCYPKLAISYCMAPQDGDSVRQLLTNVLISNRIQLNSPLSFYSRFSAQMAEKKRLQLQISDALYRAVELDQLELYFQPKLELASQQCHSAEALLRWHHPQLGTVSPAMFIPVAEQDGQINEIGLWVVRQICRQLPALQALGIHKVAFNVSGVQLQQPGFLEAVGQILQSSGVDASALEAELTESWMVADLALSNMQLAGLKALGLQIAMDDFGTGYSSLAALSRLPVDVLKIDRQLIMELDSNLHSQSMVGNVTRMAHELGLQVVVEGVETAEQLRILQDLKVDAIQGFYISRPVPVSALAAVLAGGRYAG